MNEYRATPGLMSLSEVTCFCGGRAAFNKRRRLTAERRRLEIAKRLRSIDITETGWRSRLAEELGISRWTLGRDLLAIRKTARAEFLAEIDRDFAQRKDFADRLERSLDPDPLYRDSLNHSREQRRSAV